ncbi:hypothetical protein H3Z85_12345 [Chryseobacterium indologenes]|uniref:hypothetical protein n=1 Tax=Chryseobacterium indologenes TaxID=253 RepID=UPI0003E0642E|nr:hypothetical protein [Chryseobacterium indologenes]QPQ50309.1 hypothetical protein H3Z85_12345 [Chryseobacterium indologenes]GAE66960.1 hypothetical protein CIN01S_25_00020 [Chryseobacterium indologenes NBRC 14944]SFK44784.1 hypothetical protein SAMN05421692_4391 [Chryseobacterium indologenes]SUX52922.1 Uncharacterised protein [Chryseobacterium indologenes]
MEKFNLFISAIDDDDDHMIEVYKKDLLNNSEIFFHEISNFISDNKKHYDKLQYIIDLYNIFDISEQRLSIVKNIGNLIFQIYIEIIDNLIKNGEEYSIYCYIDFFYVNNFFFREQEQIFFQKSYDILFSNLNNEESSWFIIACYRLLDLYFHYCNDNLYIEKYLLMGNNDLLKKYIINR